MFIIRFGVYYLKNEDGKKVRKIAIVPLKYLKYNNEIIPEYPKPINFSAYSVDLEVINKTLELISKDAPYKSNIEILSCFLEIISLDENLSYYYNSTARGRDLYSVKLDETTIQILKGDTVYLEYIIKTVT